MLGQCWPALTLHLGSVMFAIISSGAIIRPHVYISRATLAGLLYVVIKYSPVTSRGFTVCSFLGVPSTPSLS